MMLKDFFAFKDWLSYRQKVGLLVIAGVVCGLGGGVGLFRASLGCSRRWSQPRGTSLLQSLAPLQGISDGRNGFPIY